MLFSFLKLLSRFFLFCLAWYFKTQIGGYFCGVRCGLFMVKLPVCFLSLDLNWWSLLTYFHHFVTMCFISSVPFINVDTVSRICCLHHFVKLCTLMLKKFFSFVVLGAEGLRLYDFCIYSLFMQISTTTSCKQRLLFTGGIFLWGGGERGSPSFWCWW